jgi:outer membrane protein TolC
MTALAGILLPLVFCSIAGAQTDQNSPSLESVPQGPVVRETIPLSISSAIDRAVQYNLAAITSESDVRVARAERLRALSDLLPHLNATVSETAQQINLQAFGFRGFVGVPPVVGPFSLFDARVHLTAPIVDVRLKHELHRESEELAAAGFAQQNVREFVVLVTTELYLEALADAARVDTEQAELKTFQKLYDRAVNMKEAGAVAGIDVIRAQVQVENEQQRLVFAQNEAAKHKLRLAKAIGLPLGQQFTLTDVLPPPGASGEVPPMEEMLVSALNMRHDIQRADALVRAAEESVRAAEGRARPALGLNGDYGDLGKNPFSSHGTFALTATLSVPIFEGGRIRSEVDDSKAVLTKRTAEAESLKSRIEFDLRTAYLDIEAATNQVRAAQSAVALANETVTLAQDRFAAGVTDSVEVVQAQQTLAISNEGYISSLFALNAARANLAHAAGNGEQMIKRFFGGR